MITQLKTKNGNKNEQKLNKLMEKLKLQNKLEQKSHCCHEAVSLTSVCEI